MKVTVLRLLFCLLSVTLVVGCAPVKGGFLESVAYEKKHEVSKVFLAVVGSKNTSVCFDYLEDYLKDSLMSHGLTVKSRYYCCRDKNTDIKQVISEMLPTTITEDHILTVAITKDVVGYGTTSSRELAVSLFSTQEQAVTWSGTIKVSFDWFVSDENYSNVAKKINVLVLQELVKKGIVKA